MPLTITIPSNIERQLQSEWGSDLERRAKEALAAEGFRSGVLSLGEVAEMLNLSVNDADGFLKERDIAAIDNIDEIDDDGTALEDMLAK